jgi:hypothetical protein
VPRCRRASTTEPTGGSERPTAPGNPMVNREHPQQLALHVAREQRAAGPAAAKTSILRSVGIPHDVPARWVARPRPATMVESPGRQPPAPSARTGTDSVRPPHVRSFWRWHGPTGSWNPHLRAGQRDCSCSGKLEIGQTVGMPELTTAISANMSRVDHRSRESSGFGDQVRANASRRTLPIAGIGSRRRGTLLGGQWSLWTGGRVIAESRNPGLPDRPDGHRCTIGHRTRTIGFRDVGRARCSRQL